MAKKKGTKPTQPRKPKPRVEGLAAFAGPGADRAAVAEVEAGSDKARRKQARRIGEPDDRTISIHIDTITRAQKKHQLSHAETKRLNSIVRNAYKAAKAQGIDVDALKSAFEKAKRPAGEVIAEERNVGRYLRVMEVPLGRQYQFAFDQPDAPEAKAAEVDAGAAGEHAFRNGEPPSNNPHVAGTAQHADWSSGYHAALRRTAEEMAPPKPPGEGAPLN